MEPAALTADRHAHQHPGFLGWLIRILVIAVVNTVAVVVLSRVLSGFSVDSLPTAFMAGLVVGLLNAFVWPAVSSIVTPLSVLTLGLASLLLNGFVTYAVLQLLPGVTLGSISGVLIAVGLAVLSGLAASTLAVDDDLWYDEIMAMRAKRRAKRRGGETHCEDRPGVLFVQIDGLSKPLLERSLAAGHIPTLHRWIRQGSHHLAGWETEWSSQTGVSQCGILHGSVDNMPAFRWRDRTTGELIVSNHPWSAARIEAERSNGDGLLADNGTGYGNLFTGDAARTVMTMSTTGRLSEGKVGAGYGRYFSRPDQLVRTAAAVVVEIVRERRAAGDQRRWDVEPRVSRDIPYAGLRAFTTIISRDVSVAGMLDDMADGRSAIYVDFLGYDEVAHHSGPERPDAMAVLRDIDRQIARLERSSRFTGRPYRIVVLSDHGQTQGAPFADRYGVSLAELVEQSVDLAITGDPDSDAGRTESSAMWGAQRSRNTKSRASGPELDQPIVLGSGSLGLIYLPGPGPRLTRSHIDRVYPGLIQRLVTHPGIGFVLVATGEATGDEAPPGFVLGANGQVDVLTGEVTGENPLTPFGDGALAKIRRAHGYRDVADLMVNSMYDPVLDEVAPFEHQVGSHGGMGGPQTEPFLLAPVDMDIPTGAIDGPAALHRILKTYLRKIDANGTVTTTEAGPNDPDEVRARTLD